MAAITAAVIGAGTAIYASGQAGKQQKEANKQANAAQAAADPFAQYRPEYAERLSALAKDPSSIKDTATYKARLGAAERTMAAQGYTGSGNALAAAADAGAAAYQQEFDNLSMLSGAGVGVGTSAGVYGSAAGARGNANDNRLSAIAGVGNNIANIATMWGGRNTGGAAPASGGYGAFAPNTGFNQGAGTLGPSNGTSWNFGGG